MKIIDKIKSKNLVIAIIGLGYVGLPLAHFFSQKGFGIIGIEKSIKKITSLKKKKSYIKTISNTQLSDINFKAISDKYEYISNSDVICLCLPTPISEYKTPDLSFLLEAVNSISNYLKKGHVLMLESTTYPGTTEDLFLPIIKKNNLIPGKDVNVIYSPEREDPGNHEYNLKNTPKVISGFSKKCVEIAQNLYFSEGSKTHEVSNIKTAEMTKLLENIYRSVNIGLVNEMKIICEKFGIDVFEVINAAKTKPFGYQPFYPGPGIGGHCIPVDPYYLAWKSKLYGINAKFIELAAEINDSMIDFVCDRVFNLLRNLNKPIIKTKILVLGLSYKKNIDDLRESPCLKILNKLDKNKLEIFFFDPFFQKIPKTRDFDLTHLKYFDVNNNKISKFDLVVLLTDHDDMNYEFIYKNSKLILDTRNKFNKKSKKVFSA